MIDLGVKRELDSNDSCFFIQFLDSLKLSHKAVRLTTFCVLTHFDALYKKKEKLAKQYLEYSKLFEKRGYP